jgi:AraC-like DNA-binding protein
MCSEGAAITLPSGDIIFGTTNGYYVVERNKLMSNNAAMYKLRFTDFWIDDELQSPNLTSLYDYYVPDSKRVELPSHKSSFAIRFVSLNYQLQHRVHYQYMLEGYDTDWINADKTRIASYSGVPSGDYKFIVKAFLLESPDKYDIRELEIIVPPLFLFSTSAVWVYMLLVALVGLALLFWQQKRIRERMKRKTVKTVVHTDNDKLDVSQNIFLVQFEAWLENHYSEHKLAFDSFLQNQSMSRADFEDELKKAAKKSPREFLTDYRLEKAKQMLHNTSDSVADISFDTGFDDPVQFNRLFVNKTGMTPSQYRDHCRQTDSGATDDYEIIS